MAMRWMRLESKSFNVLILLWLALVTTTVADASNASERWAALASGAANDNLGRAHANGAFGIGRTKRQAEANAISYCRDTAFQSGAPIICAVRIAWGKPGCHFARMGLGFLPNGLPINIFGYGSTVAEANDGIFHYFKSEKVTRIKLREPTRMCITDSGWLYNGRRIEPFSNSFRFRYF